MKDVNLETTTETQSWCRIWPLNGYNHTRVKPTLLRRRKRVYESFSSRWNSQKSFILTIPWNLAKLVKTFPAIIVRQHHTDQKHMGLQKEQYAESMKGHLRYCCNPAWTKSGLRIPWNVAVFCETFKTCWETPYERRFGEPCTGPVIPFGSMVEHHPNSAKDQSRLSQFGKKVLPGICLGYVLYMKGDLERRHSGRRHRGGGEVGRARNLCSKTQCEGSVNAHEWRKLHIRTVDRRELHGQLFGFWQILEELSWNHCTSTLHRSETTGTTESAVRRIKGGTFSIQLQSGLDER